MGNNEKLYLKLLKQFAEYHTETKEEFCAALKAKNYDEATRIAHTLKGLAASIGAEELAEKAAKLEKAPLDSPMEQIQESMAECFHSLEQVIREINCHLTSNGSIAPKNDCSGEEILQTPPDTVIPLLNTIHSFIKDNDAEAVVLFDENRDNLFNSHLPSPALERLERSLARYDFDTALELIEAFLKQTNQPCV